jgi:Ca-activated chloride channel family protein
LGALALLSVAAARPLVSSDVPGGRTSIILALDESGSMCSTDVKPNRLGAAQKAAHHFVDTEPRGVRMGLVLFSGFAELAVAPTTDRGALNQAINDLSTGGGTAIGAAILKSLDAIAEIDPKVQPVGNALSSPDTVPAGAGGQGRSGGAASGGQAGGGQGGTPYVPDVIVLLTDGSNTQGISPQAAVPYAVARRVRVFTIGLGTAHPSRLECSAAQLGGGNDFGFALGGGSSAVGGGPSPLVADLPTLQQVAQRTGGTAYTAADASELNNVFSTLPRDIAVQKEPREVTVTFAAIGALLALAAFAAAIRWSPYP